MLNSSPATGTVLLGDPSKIRKCGIGVKWVNPLLHAALGTENSTGACMRKVVKLNIKHKLNGRRQNLLLMSKVSEKNLSEKYLNHDKSKKSICTYFLINQFTDDKTCKQVWLSKSDLFMKALCPWCQEQKRKGSYKYMYNATIPVSMITCSTSTTCEAAQCTRRSPCLPVQPAELVLDFTKTKPEKTSNHKPTKPEKTPNHNPRVHAATIPGNSTDSCMHKRDL